MPDQSLTVLEKIKQLASAKDAPFPLKKLGYMKLRRSVIPPETTVRVVYHLDKDSHDMLAVKSLQLGVTIDELLRLLSWAIVSE